MPTCYRRWDGWVREWNANMRVTEIISVTSTFLSAPTSASTSSSSTSSFQNQTQINLMIPILAAIGNHEAGGMFGQRMALIPFYSRYLPQQHGLQSTDPARRPMYHAHWLGNHSVLLVLDSGVTEGKFQLIRFASFCFQLSTSICVN
jgi:hypothetical protein